MSRTRKVLLLIPIVVLLVCGVFFGLGALLVSMEPEPEPVAAIVEDAVIPTDEPPEATAVAKAIAQVPAVVAPNEAATNTPARRPTNTVAPADTPTDAPTNTPQSTNTARPTNTATPRPLPTATLPPPTATLPPATATIAPPTATIPPPAPTAPPQESGIVTNVVDGDTIDINLNGAVVRVRYIGMDTPEYDQTCGTEATQANAALVAGQSVRLVRDVSETDQYGRLLRYVYVGDTFVNGALVAGGWAVAKDYPPDTAMSGVLHSLMAQGAGQGCALVVAPLPTEPVRAPEPLPVGNCDPSYPTVCIPPPPPDLDCGDIPYRRFQVLPPDPHNFDGSDNDGLGCESG